MPGGRVDGVALASIGAGAIFLYAGVTGRSVLAGARAVVSGKSPGSTPQANPITGTPPGAVAAAAGVTATTSSAIANDALRYQGAGYVWGGAPAKGPGNWDCSSFANWVIGHDLGLAIPLYKAGTYDGSSHGPPTTVWLVWPGCFNVPAAQAQPGDLVIWPTHMGIYIGGGQMISALDTADGTKVTTVAGGAPTAEGGGTYRRLAAIGAPSPTPATGAPGGGSTNFGSGLLG